MDELRWLQEWFQSCCNGDWEHLYGVNIDTLDNPGWILKINLINTKLENKEFKEKTIEIDEENWFRCWTSENCFCGVGGTKNLADIIRCFRLWAEET